MPALSRADFALRKRLRSVNQGLKRTLEHDPEALHQARVASRRLREALPLLVPGGGPESLKHAIRDMTRALGAVREMDAALALVDAVARERPDLDDALAAVRTDMVGERFARLDVMRRDIDSRRLRRASRELADEGVRRAEDDLRPGRLLAARLARRAGALRRAVADAGLLYAPERLHRVRLAIKKLRYALELTDEIGAAATKRLVADLRRMQDCLGLLHDLEIVARQARTTFGRPRTPDAAKHLAEPTLSLLEDRIRAQYATYLANRESLSRVIDRTMRVRERVEAAS